MRLVKEYAKSFFAHATEARQEKQVQKEMEALGNLDKESFEKLKIFLNNPILTESKKIEFSHLFFADFSKISLKCIDFLIFSKRENLLFEIASYYKLLFYESKQIERVFCTSAFPLEKDLKHEIENQLKSIFKSEKYVFSYSIDPSLIGGLIVQIKDKSWDFSLKKQLQDLKNYLLDSSSTKKHIN